MLLISIFVGIWFLVVVSERIILTNLLFLRSEVSERIIFFFIFLCLYTLFNILIFYILVELRYIGIFFYILIKLRLFLLNLIKSCERIVVIYFCFWFKLESIKIILRFIIRPIGSIEIPILIKIIWYRLRFRKLIKFIIFILYLQLLIVWFSPELFFFFDRLKFFDLSNFILCFFKDFLLYNRGKYSIVSTS